MPSIKQIVPICFAFYFIIFPNFTFADNITASSTCTNGVLGTYTGTADIEANFDPNTINTRWYSDGEQLTGAGVPGTCTYDAPLVPPTPEARPGYAFGGWTLKAPCLIPSTLVNTNAEHRLAHEYTYNPQSASPDICKFDNNAVYADNCAGTSASDLQVFEWKATWANGDFVIGESLCSDTYGTYGQVGNPIEDNGGNCWCRVKSYKANDAQQCDTSFSSWVALYDDDDSYVICVNGCAGSCANYVQTSAGFRALMFAGILAQ